jgi:RHS repeat-associated protein
LGTELPPAPLQNAQYYYDGDGNLVKSVVNGTTTYYPSTAYQEEVSSTGSSKFFKYYSLGGQKIAMRTISGSDNTLNWLVNDHLGSTNVTTDDQGNLKSEIRYTPFGEVRSTNGTTPTDYRYTGQLKAEVGLYYYNARWYDSYLPPMVIYLAANRTGQRLGFAYDGDLHEKLKHVFSLPIQ